MSPTPTPSSLSSEYALLAHGSGSADDAASCGHAALTAMGISARLRLCRRAIPSMAWCTPSPFSRLSRRIFQVFMRAKTFSTRAGLA